MAPQHTVRVDEHREGPQVAAAARERFSLGEERGGLLRRDAEPPSQLEELDAPLDRELRPLR